MVNEAGSAESAIIISYPTSASRLLAGPQPDFNVSSKMPHKYTQLKNEKKTPKNQAHV